MKNQKNWNSISDVFNAIESCGPFIVLRNYEELSDGNYYMNEHSDIDCLCQNSNKVRAVLNVKRNKIGSGQNHGFVQIRGQLVKFGFFHVGDKYYDTEWERVMLENRVQHDGGFYVMDRENYFYSLLYHALLQKAKLSDDYRKRLRDMGIEFGIVMTDEEDYRNTLFEYLRKNNYTVEYPKEPNVTINFGNVPKDLLGKYEGWQLRRFVHHIVNKIGKVYYAINKNYSF